MSAITPPSHPDEPNTYADAIITNTKYVLTSTKLSFTCAILILEHLTPVWPALSLSTAANLSSSVKNHAVTGELGMAKHTSPNNTVTTPANK